MYKQQWGLDSLNYLLMQHWKFAVLQHQKLPEIPINYPNFYKKNLQFNNVHSHTQFQYVVFKN